MRKKPGKKSPKHSADALIKSGERGKVELTEQQLSQVAGGTMKIRFTSTTKDKTDTY